MEGGVARNAVGIFAHAYSRCHLSFNRLTTMSLLKYFQTKSSLPKPDGPLLTVVPSSSIVAANKEMRQVLDKPEGKDSRTPTSKPGMYENFAPKKKARIGKWPRSTV